MKSKKIERLENQLTWKLAERNSYTTTVERCNDLDKEIDKIKREIKATRNRNLWARERNAAYRDCGLTRCVVNGKVFWE